VNGRRALESKLGLQLRFRLEVSLQATRGMKNGICGRQLQHFHFSSLQKNRKLTARWLFPQDKATFQALLTSTV
jgi:hypothetical protein